MFFSRYITNVSALQFFQLFRFGILLLISILFTKTHLSVKDIGIYEMLLFIAGAVSFFWISGLIQSFLPLYKNKQQGDKAKTPEIFNAFLLITFFSVAAFVFVSGFKTYILKYVNNSQEIPFYNLFAWYILLSNPANLIEYIYLLKNKAELIIQYGIVSFTLQLALVVLPVIMGYGLEWSIYGLIVISVVRLIWLLILIWKYSGFEFSFYFMKRHIKVGYPLILSALLSGSAQYIDDFLVSFFFDNSKFAIFKYGAKQFPLVVLMANAFSNAMVPVIAAAATISTSLVILKQKSEKLMHILFPVTIVFLISSKWLYPVVFNHHFAESASIFNILLLLIISYMVFPQTILIGMKKTKLILIASFSELIVHIALSLILLHYWEILGIATATVIAYFFEKILLMGFCFFILKIKPAQYIPVKIYTVYSLLSLAAFFGITYIL
ncbi:MAG: oligosaccharide flippase family protein [Bacteroidia bacterium]|nr:oligosaccharide flippase family protein [Bacteroidia bacterium]